MLEDNSFKLNNFGLGQYFRGIDEICLFGVKGKLPYKIIDGKRQQGKTVIIAPRQKHSQKPIKMYEMIEKVSYEPYLELFSRNKDRDN
jgi:N6-adenosine-specific RNA methylase IME4